MKIIIVGAGISGLTTYLFLNDHLTCLPDLHIQIYESYDVSKYLEPDTSSSASVSASASNGKDPNPRDDCNDADTPSFNVEAIGSAIGITKNGLSVLSRLPGHSTNLRDEVLKQGHPTTKWMIGSARGWKLAEANMKSKRGSEDVDSVMIGRQTFWLILLRHVVWLAGKGVVEHRRVTSVGVEEGGQGRAVVTFADGKSGMADLIIGADGLRSVVRGSMFSDAESGAESKIAASQSRQNYLSSFFSFRPDGPKDYITPQYEGLAGVGGFVPASVLKEAGQEPGTMSIVFGSNGFFGCGYINAESTQSDEALSSKAAAVYWSTFSSPDPYPYSLGNEKQRPQDFDRTKARQAMIERHKLWKDTNVQAILKYVTSNTDEQPEGFYPTWTTPELPRWTDSGRIVLVGDAAHALQPSSGQGATQGMEDAESLALILDHYLTRPKKAGLNAEEERVALRKALLMYERVRMPRVHAVYERSQKMSGMKADMGIVGEMTMYGIIKVMSLFHDGQNEKLLEYDLPGDVKRALQEA